MLSLFIKGIFIGIGKIIPGVSGAVIAMTFGIYDKLLYIVSHFFKNIKENIKFLFPILLGVIVSIIFSSKVVSFLLTKYFVITMFFFIGLIIGGFPQILNKIDKKKKINFLYMIISFILVILLSFSFETNNNISNYSFFSMILIGTLEAATMIIPGISGTAIMMLIGCYNKVLNMFSNVLSFSNLKDLIPFLIGVIIGVIIISKFISFCFKKYKEQTYSFIIGLILSSILLLITSFIPNITSVLQLVIGLVLLFIGIKLSRKLN